jgi:RimJ/RimL family protein N-acetyltransferase
MGSSPLLETPRLRLEPFAPERHLTPRYVGWLNDSLTTRYSEQRLATHTLESCRTYAASFEATPHHFWAIVARDPYVGHVGNIVAYLDERHGVADVGILVGEPSVRGRGHATEAWIAVCDHLLRSAGLRKVTAGTLSVNTPMVNLMKRVGMVDDGRRVRQQMWNGTEVDIVHAALFRASWLERFPGGYPWADPGNARRG